MNLRHHEGIKSFHLVEGLPLKPVAKEPEIWRYAGSLAWSTFDCIWIRPTDTAIDLGGIKITTTIRFGMPTLANRIEFFSVTPCKMKLYCLQSNAILLKQTGKSIAFKRDVLVPKLS